MQSGMPAATPKHFREAHGMAGKRGAAWQAPRDPCRQVLPVTSACSPHRDADLGMASVWRAHTRVQQPTDSRSPAAILLDQNKHLGMSGSGDTCPELSNTCNTLTRPDSSPGSSITLPAPCLAGCRRLISRRLIR